MRQAEKPDKQRTSALAPHRFTAPVVRTTEQQPVSTALAGMGSVRSFLQPERSIPSFLEQSYRLRRPPGTGWLFGGRQQHGAHPANVSPARARHLDREDLPTAGYGKTCSAD